MSDGVLAAVIAACATVFASFLQLRATFTKEVAARAFPSSGRRKSRKPLMLFLLMLGGGAAVGGFALSQWLMEHERSMQSALQEELQARIAALTKSETQLAGTRSEIEAGVMKRLGLEGVVVIATVAPCKAALLVSTPTLASHADTPAPSATATQPTTTPPPASTCAETDASPVTLCATVPMGATVTEIELFTRAADSDVPWANARVTAGVEAEQSRFAEKPMDIPDGAQSRQVCETFSSWSSEHARVARMLVRYSL
jgi:hypothetical protein